MSEESDMSGIEHQEAPAIATQEPVPASEFEDIAIDCTDCSQAFVWTAGEQAFFQAKQLSNPPKRCKPCKRAKNRRLEAVEIAKTSGQRQRVEVPADCARCGATTTVPFYPCQGRPVFCRQCYLESNNGISAGVSA